MKRNQRKASILLPNSGGLNFGIWLDEQQVSKARPRVISFRKDDASQEEACTSLTQQMESQRRDWEITGRT